MAAANEGRGGMADEVSDEEALRRLREFLRDVQRILSRLHDRPRRVIGGRHHARLAAAWESLAPKFDSAFAALASSTASNALPTLRLRGLAGHELVFKLEVFAEARDRYLDHGRPKRGRSRRWWARWHRRAEPLFEAADVLLAGLGAVFPGLEAVREHMASIVVAIDLRE